MNEVPVFGVFIVAFSFDPQLVPTQTQSVGPHNNTLSPLCEIFIGSNRSQFFMCEIFTDGEGTQYPE